MGLERYSQQIKIIGNSGQNLLTGASVLIVGCGGIGSPLALYLSSCGVGNIYLYDHDNVEISNLHRQILFDEVSIGKNKAVITKEQLNKKNSLSTVVAEPNRFNASTYDKYIDDVDLIIDASDNFETMYFVNDICCLHDKKFITTSIQESVIQVSAFDPLLSCYRCMFSEPPPSILSPSCSDVGVMGTVTGIAGTFTANLALKVILNNNSLELGKFNIFDTNDMSFTKLPVHREHQCKSCVLKDIELFNIDDYSISLENEDRDSFYIIDIRNKDEREKCKIDDDAHIPLEKLKKDFFNKDIRKKVLLYCQSEIRSRQGVKILREQGTEAYFLSGGMVSC